MQLEPGQTLAHYRVIERIGKGGMGEVWSAVDTRLDREVALKLLPPEVARGGRLARFQREARAVAALNHPNVVTLYSVEEAGSLIFFTMERVHGKTLSELIPEEGLDLSGFLRHAIPLTDAVCAAHERGIVHRDLKPGNVMVGEDGRLKVLDFGLAKLRAREEAPVSDAGVTEEGAILGTAAYMSPEQARAQTVDERSDVFALGVVFYEMAVGWRPFQGSGLATLLAVIANEPQPVEEIRPDLPRRLSEMIARCLQKKPEDRFQSALELREELNRIVEKGSATASDAPRSIAVLTFDDLSPDKDQDYFCEGMAEEIISALTQVEGLKVASRLAASQFKGVKTDCRTIGKRLGVRTVLEGSVRKAGDRLRIAAQLIDVADDSHLWAERYDRQLEDVFDIQDEIAQSIAAALRVELAPKPRDRDAVSAPHAEAYDYYLRGRFYFYRGSRKDHEFARQMFSRAIEIDPSYARAWAGLADSAAFIFKHFDRSPALLEEARKASVSAMELDPDSAEARTSFAVYVWMSGDTEGCREEFEAAIRMDPQLYDAHYLYGQYAINVGRVELAARELELAAAVRPDDHQATLVLGAMYRALERSAQADMTFARGLAVAEKHLEFHPDDARARYLAAGALVALGDVEKGLDWARMAYRIDPENTLLLYNLGGIFGAAGRLEEGIGYLEKAVELGFRQTDGIENDPDFGPLRSHPRFERLLERLREGD